MDRLTLLTFGISTGIALLLTPLCIWTAHRFKVIDHPGGLKTHEYPVPYLGGLAVYAGFLAGLIVTVLWFGHSLGGMRDILIGAGLIFLLGLIDDVRPLSIPLKFFWQGGVAWGVAYFGDVSIQVTPWPWLNLSISVLWMVGMTNAMNIIDIMDGLAGGTAFLAALTFIVLAGWEQMSEVMLLAAALGGAVFGVLCFNWRPAKIYYGDAGSLMIGFILAALAMAVRYSSHNVIGLAAPLLILSVPLFDTFFVMWQRRSKGKSMFFGSPDHFALRLERRGWSRLKVVTLVHLGTAALCGFVLWSTHWTTAMGAIGYSAIGLCLTAFAWWLHKHAP